jgi:hypothetical protein
MLIEGGSYQNVLVGARSTTRSGVTGRDHQSTPSPRTCQEHWSVDKDRPYRRAGVGALRRTDSAARATTSRRTGPGTPWTMVRREQLLDMLVMEENRLERQRRYTAACGRISITYGNRSNRPIAIWTARCAVEAPWMPPHIESIVPLESIVPPGGHTRARGEAGRGGVELSHVLKGMKTSS